ncbi:MAG: hypothetical protein ABFD75_15185 [Smithella sp.]
MRVPCCRVGVGCVDADPRQLRCNATHEVTGGSGDDATDEPRIVLVFAGSTSGDCRSSLRRVRPRRRRV